MAEMDCKSLHDYYSVRGFKPTFASFISAEELDRYEIGRIALYRDILGLPKALFCGAQVCEYGPDTGENALVFARWGSRLTLVEPNKATWADIRSYFQRFNLESHLESIVGDTVETFHSPVPLDFINAEGFIYTVQPSDIWLKRFAEQLAPEGFVVANYLERSGCLLELLWSLFHSRYGSLIQQCNFETAYELFEPKWNSIPHTRPFESWVQDVLENPFVRLKYFIEPSELLARAAAVGLKLHSSWPRYEDPFHPYWHKRIPDDSVLEMRRSDFIARSRISFAFARSLFVVGDAEVVAAVNHAILNLVGAIDGLIDQWQESLLAVAFSALGVIDSVLAGNEVMADAENREQAIELLKSLRLALELLNAGDPASIRDFTRSDHAIITNWGATTHYVALRHSDAGPGRHS